MHLQIDNLIELRNISMQYDMRSVLEDINLQINDGDFIAITGPNGGGKTTLLKIILKLIKPTSGEVIYNESVDNRLLRVGYLPQKNMIDSSFPITVREVISSGLLREKKLFGRYTDTEKERIASIMVDMGVETLKDQPIGLLSGGQLQRALLGRALISNPHLLVLDEPLSYVDKTFEKQIYEIIAAIKDKTTIILVSHEMTSFAPMATRHLVINHKLHDCHSKHHYANIVCE